MKALKSAFFALFILVSAETSAQTAWELWFTTEGTQYHGMLILDETGLKGKVRLKFYSTRSESIENVEQQVNFETTAKWKRYACYNARYAGTNTTHPSYVTDNFYFIEDSRGSTRLYNIDDRGAVAEVTITQVKTSPELNRCFIEFGWQKSNVSSNY